MPTYVYKFVKTGETIEVQQSFTEATLTAVVHPRSGRKMAVKKVFTPVGVTFRGDGFYKTDSRTTSKKAAAKADGAEKSGSEKSASEKSSDSSDSSTKSSTSDSAASGSNKSDTKATAAP